MTNEEFDKQGFCYEAKAELKDGKIYNLDSVNFQDRTVDFIDNGRISTIPCSLVEKVINDA